MLYTITLHFFAGAVTGPLFKVRTLLVLLGFVTVEFIVLSFMRGSIAWQWVFLNIIALEAGYFAGIFARSAIEYAGYLAPLSDRTAIDKIE